MFDSIWNEELKIRHHLCCYRTISSTTLRADWSISSWTSERQWRARACCSGSSWTISSPYRYTPMAWSTHTQKTVYLVYFFSGWIRQMLHSCAYLLAHESESAPHLRKPECTCVWPQVHTSDVGPANQDRRLYTVMILRNDWLLNISYCRFFFFLHLPLWQIYFPACSQWIQTCD